MNFDTTYRLHISRFIFMHCVSYANFKLLLQKVQESNQNIFFQASKNVHRKLSMHNQIHYASVPNKIQ